MFCCIFYLDRYRWLRLVYYFIFSIGAVYFIIQERPHISAVLARLRPGVVSCTLGRVIYLVSKIFTSQLIV